MVRVICVIDVVCLRSDFHVVRAGDVNAFFWGPYGVILSLGDEEHARPDLLFRTPAEGSRTVAGLARKAHSSLPAQHKSLLRLGSANYSYSSSYEIHHCISEILDDFFHHWFLLATFSSILLSLTHYRIKHVFGLWMFAAVVALMSQFKREKSSMTLMPSRLVYTFSIPGAWKYFQSCFLFGPGKINEENWVHLQLLYKVISLEGHTLYWP